MTFVSVIVPCFNEEKTIHLVLNALKEQNWPCTDMEIVIADGLSTDATRERIAQYQQDHPDLTIRIVDNPARNIPAALNTAIRNAYGEIIVRMDAHSIPAADYVELCVRELEAGKGDNVGGIWLVTPGADTAEAHAISAAAAHPFGVGNAQYRITNKSQYVKTVPFGSFYRALTDKIGFFNENLLTNEDYEFNARILKSGGKIWLNPGIKCKYFSRDTLWKLAQQYWRYGFWKVRMLQIYPETLRWRQAVPPLFVLSLPVLILLGFLLPIFHVILLIETIFYAIILMIAGIQTALKYKKSTNMILVPAAIFVMHIAWGSAFLWSLPGALFSKKANRNQEG